MSKQQRRLILESYQIYINPWYSVICIWKTFPLQREDSHVEHCALQTRAKSTKRYQTAKIFCIMDWISRTNTYTQHAVFDKADWPSSKQTFKKKKEEKQLFIICHVTVCLYFGSKLQRQKSKLSVNKSGVWWEKYPRLQCMPNIYNPCQREDAEENRSTRWDQYPFHASVVPLALYKLLAQQLNSDLNGLCKWILSWVW